jgi:uncharacterized protein (DUF111 family)
MPVDRDRMLDLVFRESTTFGIRERQTRRSVLERSFQTVKTEYGEVAVKIGQWNNDILTVSPEIEDCRKRAQENGVSVRAVYEAAKKGFK